MERSAPALLALLALAGCSSGFRPLTDSRVDPVDAAGKPRRDGPAASGWTLVYQDPEAKTGESLNALWMADPKAVFAVGDNGQVVQYDGTSWTALNKTAGAHYQGLHGRSAADVTAVGIYSWTAGSHPLAGAGADRPLADRFADLLRRRRWPDLPGRSDRAPE